MKALPPPNGAAAGRKLSLRRHLIAGTCVIALLVGTFGGWAATADLSGAVIAPGTVVVDSSVKSVQHPTGGVVGALNVREGDRVKAGDVLITLDETETRTDLKIVTDNLDELAVRRARLLAERDGEPTITYPDDILKRKDEPHLAFALSGESKLFETRRQGNKAEKSQLREQIAQLAQEVRGLEAQLTAKDHEAALVAEDLGRLQDLWSKNLVSVLRVTEMQRAEVQLEGARGELTAQIASTKGRAVETELQILRIDQDLRNEVGKEIADIRAKTTELEQRKVEAEDRLRRTDIRAPLDGIVHELEVHTVGGVVKAGETLMYIVPNADTLVVEARVTPEEIDRVGPNQNVRLRFSAFDQRTTPEIDGKVARISPDVTEDERTGRSYYTVRVIANAGEIASLGAGKLMPGMPVETYISTGERSPLSYFLKPLTDQMNRAFRDG
jgi:HlyD family secretion protein